MRRSQLPSPTRFIRAAPTVKLTPDEEKAFLGKPFHPIIKILDAHAPLRWGTEEGEAGILVVVLLNQDAYGVDVHDKSGDPVKTTVWPFSDRRRYMEKTMTRKDYYDLPICTWEHRGDLVLNIKEVHSAAYEMIERKRLEGDSERKEPEGEHERT